MARRFIGRWDARQDNDVAAVEVGVQVTKAVRLQRIGQATVLKDYWIEDSLIAPDTMPLKVLQPHVRRLVDRLGAKNISLIVNDHSAFSTVQKVDAGTEDAIRAHIQQSLAQAQGKIDLTKYFWTVAPLNNGFDDQQGLTEALSNRLNILVCAVRKENVEAVRSAFEKEGVNVERTYFQMSSLLKAFEFFSANALDQQVVAMLHLSHTKYSLAMLRNYSLVAHRELRFNGTLNAKNHTLIRQEIKTQLTAAETRFKTPVRCVFVSGDYLGNDLFVRELKENGCYARPWNVARRLSTELDDTRQETLQTDGAQLNAVVGAALSTIQAREASQPVKKIKEPSADISGRWQKTAPFLAFACCLLVGAFWYLSNSNYLSDDKVKAARDLLRVSKAENRLLKAKETASVVRRADELESFLQSRRSWPPVLAELHKLNLSDVRILQIKASDNLSRIEVNPFDMENNTGPKRKTSGSILLEARNSGGLNALEDFMARAKNSAQLKPLLHKKIPVRLVNNVSNTTNSTSEVSFVTLEFLLDEKHF